MMFNRGARCWPLGPLGSGTRGASHPVGRRAPHARGSLGPRGVLDRHSYERARESLATGTVRDTLQWGTLTNRTPNEIGP
jgi:hypothetical protein